MQEKLQGSNLIGKVWVLLRVTSSQPSTPVETKKPSLLALSDWEAKDHPKFNCNLQQVVSLKAKMIKTIRNGALLFSLSVARENRLRSPDCWNPCSLLPTAKLIGQDLKGKMLQHYSFHGQNWRYFASPVCLVSFTLLVRPFTFTHKGPSNPFRAAERPAAADAIVSQRGARCPMSALKPKQHIRVLCRSF